VVCVRGRRGVREGSEEWRGAGWSAHHHPLCDFSAPATPVTARPCRLRVVHVQVLELTNLGSLAHDVFYHNTRKLMTDILEVRRPVWWRVSPRIRSLFHMPQRSRGCPYVKDRVREGQGRIGVELGLLGTRWI
jgi:hypothetical protein